MHEMELMVTVPQAAEILGVSRWTVTRRIEAGTLTAYKLGGGTSSPWVLRRADVEASANRNE